MAYEFHRWATIRKGLWALAAGAALVAGAAYLFQELRPAGTPPPSFTGEAAIRSAFTLTDHNGNRVSAADFRGKWQLVFFGFTHCPDICPTTLAYMARALDSLGGQTGKLAPLFITVDPTRDTPDVMAEYVAAFHPELIGLTGSEDDIAAAAKAFRVYHERIDQQGAPDGYTIAHSGHIYLMTPQGRFETVFREADQPAQTMAKRIRILMETSGS